MKLYVIGPITGREIDNLKEFQRAKTALFKAGYEVVIPHDLIPKECSHDQAMLMSIHNLTSYKETTGQLEVRKKFAVAMLSDWRESPGARLEYEVAKACGIICKPWTDWL